MTLTADTAVHLIIPCFRESRRVRPFLTDLCREFSQVAGVSILVVDDGSGEEETARMRTLVEEFRPANPMLRELLALPQNVGKGGAVYAGWEAHRSEPWLMFVDADGSVPATEVARLIQQLRADPVTGRAYFASRVTMLGRRVERMWHRDVMGQIFHWVVNFLLGLPAHDTQCGCKLVPRAAFERARPGLSLHGFAFDLDLLLGLQDAGCEVIEVPVDWHEEPGGTIRLVSDSWKMLKDVWRLRRRRRAVQTQS